MTTTLPLASTLTLPPPLDELPAAQQQLLADLLEPVEVPAGTTLFNAGDAGDGCLLVDEGVVRLDVPSDEVDSDATLGYAEPRSLLGELSLLDGLPRSVTATAETDVRARRLTPAGLDALLTEHPQVGAAVLRALGRDAARKLRGLTDRMAEHLAGDARDPEVEAMVATATAAQRELAGWSEERVDALLSDLAQAFAASAETFAQQTVDVTHLGNVADKTFKNTLASVGIVSRLLGEPGQGAMAPPSTVGVTPVAAPAGVVFGLIPMTNPVATAMYKTLITLKGRNALILSFHRACLPLAATFDDLVGATLDAHGAPRGLVQSVRNRASRQRTARFMAHPDVAMVLATGGPGMVRAAYRSGTPAIGVGPGNAPAWVAPDADLAAAAQAVVISKSFDNGLICGAEHNLVVDVSVRERFVAELEAAGAAVLDEAETERFLAAAVDPARGAWQPHVTGQAAALLAQAVGVERPHDIRVLVVPSTVDLTSPLAGEKMGPFLSLFTVDGEDAALALSLDLLAHMGAGHTAMVHTSDRDRALRFAEAVPASRVLVNSPGAHGVFGYTTGLEPSLTLGCGTFGGNSTTDNVTWRHLVNVKRMAEYRDPAAQAPPG